MDERDAGLQVPCGSRRPGKGRTLALLAAVSLVASLVSASVTAERLTPQPPAPAREREAWRAVEAGPVTVVGTASDPKLVETAETLRALVSLLPGLVPGAFGATPALVVAVAHDPGHLALVGLPGTGASEGRIVLETTGEAEARGALLGAAVSALARRARTPLPAWAVAGLAEYLSTLSVAGQRATLGRLVAGNVAVLSARRLSPGRPALFGARALEGEDEALVLQRAEAWAVVHYLLHAVPDGGGRLGRFAALLAEGRAADEASVEALGAGERTLLARAREHVVAGRSLARFVPVPPGTAAGRILPLTRTGAAAVLGGVARGRNAPTPALPLDAGDGGGPSPPAPSGGRAPARPSAAVSRDVPAEVDLVNRLIDEGREDEALGRLERLHASLGGDPEMQRALGWDVQEVRRVVVHNRLVRRYNEAIGLLNAGRLTEAVPIFREVAAAAEDPGLRRLAWERATAPDGGRR